MKNQEVSSKRVSRSQPMYYCYCYSAFRVEIILDVCLYIDMSYSDRNAIVLRPSASK